MNQAQIHEYAASLLRARGGAAEAEAAQKAGAHEAAGNAGQAGEWRRVRAAIAALRGPRAS